MKKSSSEKITFPEIRQIGVIVRDVDEAIKYYTTEFGIGPFTTVIMERKGGIMSSGRHTRYKISPSINHLVKT